jgi:hypothetical protein
LLTGALYWNTTGNQLYVWDGSAWDAAAFDVSGGSVTSVAMTVPTGLTVSGSPITSTGTLAVSYSSGYSIPTTTSQSNWDTAYSWGNHASAGYLTSVSLTTNVTDTLPIANGGSGQTTAQSAMNAFAGAVTSGQYLRGNGTNVVMSTIQAADVPTLNQNTTGTATNATNVAVTTSTTSSAFKVPFANTTASTTGNYGLLQDSTATFTYNPSTNTLVVGTVSGALSGNATTATTLQTARTIQTNLASTSSASFNGSANITPGVTGTLAVGNGGTGGTTFSANSVLLGNNGSVFQTVAPGSSGNVLTSNGTTWTSTAPAASGITTGKAIAMAIVFG